MKSCILYDRECIDCGECDMCPYQENKVCDNCFECLKTESDYATIQIDAIIEDESAPKKEN